MDGAQIMLASGLTFAALIACHASAAAQPSEESLCGVVPDAYEFGARETADTFALLEGQKKVLRLADGGAFRMALRFPEGAGTGGWKLAVAPGLGAPYEIDAARLARHGRDVLSPIFTGAVEVSLSEGAPEPVITVFALDGVPGRQLGVVDGESGTFPNWCRVAEYQGAEAGQPPNVRPAGAKVYSPGPENFRTAINSVAAIGIVNGAWGRSRDKYLSLCTGFFVAPDLVITNRHCLCPTGDASALHCQPADAQRPQVMELQALTAEGASPAYLENVDRAGGTTTQSYKVWTRVASADQAEAPDFEAVVPRLIGGAPGSKRPLDYALLEVNAAELPAGAIIRPARLAPGVALAAGTALAIPQYPGNYPYAINYDGNCRIFAVDGETARRRYERDSEGRLVGANYFFARHGCDTAQGSSGSPVFLRDLSAVVGLHACCWNQSDDLARVDPEGGEDRTSDAPLDGEIDDRDVNRFVPLADILCDIRERDGELFERIRREGIWGDDWNMATACSGS